MTDCIAYLNNEPISIFEYQDKPIDKKDTLKCICGENVFFRKESCEFTRKNSHCIIKKMPHFSHHKNTDCPINNLIDYDKTKFVAIGYFKTNEMDRRVGLLSRQLYIAGKALKKHNEINGLVNHYDKIIKNNNLDITIQPNLLILKDNYYEAISIKQLDTRVIDINIKYRIMELELYPKIKIHVSSNYYTYICSNIELFKHYIKQIGIIIQFYSRCVKYTYIDNQLEILEREVNNQITKKQLEMFIDD